MSSSPSPAPPASAVPLAWLPRLAPAERRTFWACFAGWALDAFDFQLYTFVLPALTAAWTISRGQAGLLGTVALLTSAAGGWLAGWLADRIGRVRTLQLTIAWFAAFTFLSGLTQNYGQLLVVRALLGIGFGGEWVAGAVLMGEVIRPELRGRAVGSVQAGWALGWGGAALAATALFSALPPGAAWRTLFLLGLLPAGLVFFLRRHVPEPEVYRRAAAARRARPATAAPPGTEPPAPPGGLAIFGRALLPTTLGASLLATGAQGGYYAVTTWLPTYLRQERHLSVLGSGGYLAVIVTGSLCGYLTGADLADRWGRRRNFFFFSLGALTAVLLYVAAARSDAATLLLGFPLGFFASGVFSGIGPFFTELFPTAVRGSGQGFAYNFGRGVGALFPGLVGFLGSRYPLGLAIGAFAAAAYTLMFVAARALPETRGRALLAADPPAGADRNGAAAGSGSGLVPASSSPPSPPPPA